MGNRKIIGRTSVAVLLLGTVYAFLAWSRGPEKAYAYHSAEEMEAFQRGTGLPGGQNTHFMASGNCEGCHGFDFNGFANVSDEGADINPVDHWRSTMMANSAHDPLWRAKVSHEVLVNPAHQVGLEDKCTSCHAPMGRHDKYLTGGGPYSISEMVQDPVALDGVSCVACHIQSADSIGKLNSGNMKFDLLGRPLYGPYSDNIFGAPMTSFVGYTPLHGEHINDAGLCASCHTLITETADLAGNLTGGTFVEQATYHEWLNSDFNTNEHIDGISCQGCHVPRVTDSVVISANYTFLDRRSPYGLHYFAGANTFMLNLLKNNRVTLGLSATAAQFDSTIERTLLLLQQNSLDMQAQVVDRTADTAYIDVSLTNLVGHKFPSGYPARRAFVELVVTNAMGDTLFRSGGWDETWSIIGHDAEWEPHYDVIDHPDKAQIYEMVMGDVNGNKTTVLERADVPLKDNRLVPSGFSTTHFAYDTTVIAGVPASDLDFNRDELGVEGNGGDVVHYRVPMNGYTDQIQVHVKFWYQSVPPRWLDEMFAFNSPEIDTFRVMYENEEPAPVLISETSFTDLSVGIDDLRELGVLMYPNPVFDGVLRIDRVDERVEEIIVHDLNGRTVARPVTGKRHYRIELPRGGGTFLVTFRTRERSFTEKVVSF
ncbi:MAG: hypothetical protein KDB88_10545 [Flavobacteriales bacterium]|nr:hypothetical protein [Flavobacteriales bacterium]